MKMICRSLAAGSLVALLALGGCKQSVDLDAIKALAVATDAASSSYATLAQDLNDSCIRMYEWNWAAARTYTGFPTLANTCGADAVAATQWQQANQVLVAYVRSLGALAGGDDTNTDFGIPGLLDAFNFARVTSLKSDQTTAISKAGADLVTDIFNIRRRNEISKYAPKANDDLAMLIAALKAVAETNYNDQLNLERDAINHFYAPLVANVALSPSPSMKRATRRRVPTIFTPRVTRSIEDFDKVQLLTLRDRFRQDRAALDSRRSAIDAYERSLSSIALAHSALVKSIQSEKLSDVGGIIQSYVSQLKPDIQTISKAFAGDKP